MSDAVIYGDIAPEILEREVSIAFGANRRDMKFGTTTKTFGWLLDRLSTFDRGPKDGPCLLQGGLVAGQRVAKNVLTNDLLMLDFDTGATFEEVGKAVIERGLFAVLWTTHSHLKTTSDVAEASFEQYARKKRGYKGFSVDIPDEWVLDYLRDEKRILPRVLEGATVGKPVIKEGGRVIPVTHQPMPRLRALFLLKEKFDFGNRGGTQKEAIDEWKRRYTAASDSFGLFWDTQCIDPSRLMYLPRIAPGAEIAEGQHEIAIIPGECFDFDAIDVSDSSHSRNVSDRLHSGGGGANNAFTQAAAMAGVKDSHDRHDGHGERAKLETPGLMKFLKDHGHDFEAAEWYASHDQDIRFTAENGYDFVCINDSAHSTPSSPQSRDFMVRNAGDGRGWMMLCLHETCKHASGEDRAWYLDFAMQQFGVGVDDLVEFSASAREAKAKGEADGARVEAAEKLGEDVAALEAAVNALTPKTPEAEVAAVVEVIAAKPEENLTAIRLTALLGEKLEIGKTNAAKMVKASRKSLLVAKKSAASVSSVDAYEHDLFGEGEGSVSRKHPVPRNKAACATIWMDWDANDRKDVALARLMHLNKQTPKIFMQPDGGIVRVREIDGSMKANGMGPSDWTATLYDYMEFRMVDAEGIEHGVPPPTDLSMYVNSSENAVYPILEQLVHIPVFGPDGKLRTKRGYDPDLRIFLDPDMDYHPLPERITDEDLDLALDLLLGNALRDFPFSDAFNGAEVKPIKSTEVDADGFPLPNFERGPGSRANALCMILQPFARGMIKGPTPAYHLDKASPGTGANYLADVLGMIVEGTRCTTTPMASDNDEVRKTVTSLMREAPPIVFFDNINRKVTSEAVAAALTTGVWKDRVLGESGTTGKLPIKCVWIFAGNNIQFSSELYRRLVPIRMDASVPNPAMTRGEKDFKHFPLHDWLAKNRKELVWACHVIIGWWVQQGMPRSRQVFNSFDEWRAVMGGILETAGIHDLCTNVPAYLKAHDDDATDAADFVEQSFRKLGADPFTTAQLWNVFKNPVTELFDGSIEIAGRNEHAQTISLGVAIRNDLLGKTFDIFNDAGEVTRVKLTKVERAKPAKYQYLVL